MDKNARELITELMDAGMTQAAIANEIGVTQGAISQVVNDARRIGFRFDVGYRLLKLHASKVTGKSLDGLGWASKEEQSA